MNIDNLDNLEENKFKITFSVDSETFKEGIKKAYDKNKGKFRVEGFRKGKAPRKIIELTYGKDIFYEDAVNFVLPKAYGEAIEEADLKPVSSPEIDIQTISEETGITFTAIVYTKPLIEINDFKNITYKAFDTQVSEEEIDGQLNIDRDKNARVVSITDRAVENNDTVNIDFEGSIDGVPFEGGKGEDFELTIGSKTFIDTFEEQLIGHCINEDIEVNVTFPVEYHVEDLRNKLALFKVKIKEIKAKEFPNLDDEFAQDVSEFDTLEEYKNSIREKIQKDKELKGEQAKELEVIEKLIKRANFDVPEVMIQNHIEGLISDLSNKLNSQGMSLDTYLQYMGQTKEDLNKLYRENAEIQVKGRIALEAVANKENFQVTDEEFNEELGRMATAYNITLDKLTSALRSEDKDNIELDIKVKRAAKLVLENAIVE